MLSFVQLASLIVLYVLSVIFILHFAYASFKRDRFSFHFLFTIIYLLTLYLGFPFSLILSLKFEIPLASFEMLFATLFISTAFYVLYYVAYSIRIMPLKPATLDKFYSNGQINSKTEAKITSLLLILIVIGSVSSFFVMNGFLLFKLESYQQIFSYQVSGVGLKRFFYFFIPSFLILYFLYPSKKMWWLFLLLGVAFGALTYTLVGGTRANIAIAVALFVFIGIAKEYIAIPTLLFVGALGIVGMFVLAAKRYGLDINADDSLYSFLYLTRDTFSPWENFTLLLNRSSDIEFQGLMPIIRDFYVFIPKTLWEGRPDLVVNTANYFTWNILNYQAGLTISPTILGSLFIMGGIGFIVIGAILIGILIKGFDTLYFFARNLPIKSTNAIIQTFCFANIFNFIVLVREGMDAFVSRFIFFTLIFLGCYLLAKFITLLFRQFGFVSVKPIELKKTVEVVYD